MRLVTVCAFVLIASIAAGCAGIVERSDRAAERVGSAVTDYCETTSPEDREALRARVNDAAEPHAVEMICD